MTNAETNDTAASVAAPGATAAPERAAAKSTANRQKTAPKGPKTPTGAKSKKPAQATKKPARKTASSGKQTKSGMILELIGRAKGATLPEMMKAVAWQAHSVRGFLSTAAKKRGLKIESTKTEAGDRVYQIKK